MLLVLSRVGILCSVQMLVNDVKEGAYVNPTTQPRRTSRWLLRQGALNHPSSNVQKQHKNQHKKMNQHRQDMIKNSLWQTKTMFQAGSTPDSHYWSHAHNTICKYAISIKAQSHGFATAWIRSLLVTLQLSRWGLRTFLAKLKVSVKLQISRVCELNLLQPRVVRSLVLTFSLDAVYWRIYRRAHVQYAFAATYLTQRCM